MEDSVDILLTTYNTKIEYLKKQIDSILNQTYKSFTLIISDDCSPNEEVREILKEYEQKDERIKLYFQEKNLGCTKSFEFLLKQSTAEYIAFSDHDDIWYSNKIEESLKAIKEENVSLVYCDANQIDENDNNLNESYLRYKNMPIVKGKDFILPYSRHIAIGCSQMITKEVKEKMLPFTENTFAHDWHSAYIASNINGIYCIDKPLFGYRIHENNIFGGRSFKQNMKIWKRENGNSYKSYLKYRHKVITKTYLAGVLMCKDYSSKIDDKLKVQEDEVIKYYEKSQKSKVIYLALHKYFKFLYFKGIRKRALKEIMILHLPLISYIIYSII
ncbi:MAG: glycosyltransferase [Clostridia bacterium]|jgi:glycosyltransferase involved in cell wall biosynthesis|nr:glycosyltransferase [Clostridia bacterium]